MKKGNRIWELDFWRGLAIILVVFDHAFYDFARIFRDWRYCEVGFLQNLNYISQCYLESDVRFFWRPAFLFLFFCVSGICTALSRNNFLRGIKLWCVAVFISIITFIGAQIGGGGIFVLFGVLHCLAVIILIYSLIQFLYKTVIKVIEKLAKKKICDKVKNLMEALIMLLLAGGMLSINFAYNPRLVDVVGTYKVSNLDGKLFGIFFYTEEWWTADYFPLFPYISFFFFGVFIAKIIYKEKKSLFPMLDGKWHNVLSYAGRHSLIVYLFGQVIAILLGVLLSLFFLGESLLFS